jgi:hypothetical protein
VVDRDRAARRQRYTLRADRLVVFAERCLAEEHERLVEEPELAAFLGVRRHPLADLLHRHFFARVDVAIDQEFADGRVLVAVLRR